jgi:cytochrome P450
MTLADGAPDLLAAALSTEFQDDPYPVFHALRESDPVHQTAIGPWLVSRYDDAVAVLRDPHLSNDRRRAGLGEQARSSRAGRDEGVMLFVDPPDHTRLRGLVSKAFTPRTVERLRSRIQELVDQLLDAAEAQGDRRLDVVTELAYPLPVAVICELLGVPIADQTTFQGWSRELAASLDPDVLRTPEQEARLGEAAEDFARYFTELIGERRRSPGPDLLSGLIAAEQDGDRLSQIELLNTAMFLLVAGHETTVNLIGNGSLALLRQPDQMRRLRHDPSLDRPAIDELLRYDSPVQFTQRFTLADHQVGDVLVPAGSQVLALLAAANRDPAMFPDPDRLDLARPNAHRHVAFGGGPHFCLGASLARLEGEIAIGTLVRRWPTLELAGEPVRRGTFTLRGLDHLPVAW